FTLALVLTLFASFILPPIFLYLLIKRYALKTPAIFDGKEHKRKNFCGGYLLLSGIILVMVSPQEWFWGSWVAICGIAIFLLGPSWWAQKYEQPSLRLRIIDRTALILAVLQDACATLGGFVEQYRISIVLVGQRCSGQFALFQLEYATTLFLR